MNNMPGRASKDRDFVTVARRVVEHAIGEKLDGSPLEDPDSTLRVTPAMEAGISDHIWSLEEMCILLPETPSAAKRIDKGLILKALGERIEA